MAFSFAQRLCALVVGFRKLISLSAMLGLSVTLLAGCNDGEVHVDQVLKKFGSNTSVFACSSFLPTNYVSFSGKEWPALALIDVDDVRLLKDHNFDGSMVAIVVDCFKQILISGSVDTLRRNPQLKGEWTYFDRSVAIYIVKRGQTKDQLRLVHHEAKYV